MKRPIPLVRPLLPSLHEIEAELQEMFDSGRLTNFGPFSRRLERETETLLGVRGAAATSNATAALTLVLDTLPPGSEVILPSFTFIATAQSVVGASMTPVFADVDPSTLTLDASSVEACLTPSTCAIVAVHAFGVPCDIFGLEALSQKHGLMLVFDSAHAYGSRYGGVPVGRFGHAEVFSLSATKVVPAGEGGLVTTNYDGLLEAVLDRRNYGLRRDGSGDCANHGWNAKMTEFNAILAVKELETLEWRVCRRNQIAQRYLEMLRDVPGLQFQRVPDGDRSTYKDFTIQVDPVRFGATRDELRAQLARLEIESAPYFWPPLHRMTYFNRFVRASSNLSVTERVAESVLSLPLFESMTDEEMEFVAGSVAEIGAAGRRRQVAAVSNLVDVVA
jgi:dTDP-4-amino-4,6-dideoxygalactose transaminase